MIPAAAQETPLAKALRLYDDIPALMAGVIAAAPEQRVRLTARIINLCHELDVALDRAGVAPMGDRGRR